MTVETKSRTQTAKGELWTLQLVKILLAEVYARDYRIERLEELNRQLAVKNEEYRNTLERFGLA